MFAVLEAHQTGQQTYEDMSSELSHRCLLSLCLTEPEGLAKLGRSLHEQAGVFYLDASRRVLSLHAERRAPLPELNARISFKVS